MHNRILLRATRAEPSQKQSERPQLRPANPSSSTPAFVLKSKGADTLLRSGLVETSISGGKFQELALMPQFLGFEVSKSTALQSWRITLTHSIDSASPFSTSTLHTDRRH